MSEAQPELLDGIRVVIRLARIAQQACEEVGLTLAQYRALHSAEGAGRRAYELAQATAVSRPAVTSLTAGMVRAGLIARETSPTDGRGVVFVVTERGAACLRNAEERLVARFTEVLGEAAESLLRVDVAPLLAALDERADREFGART